MIYEYICSKGQLSDAHRNELKTKRGFTDETIKRNRFFSGGQYLLALEKELSEKFSAEELLQAGVFLKKGTSVNMDPILLNDRIIIPYLDENGLAVLLRPHKLGLKGIPVQIYQPFNVRTDLPENDVSRETLIITEGEFKATAAWQLGANCIALPGIASFSGDIKYPDLIKFLNDYQIKHVCIIFDNEIKDDPKFPNYKPDIMDRFDTQYFAYLMATKLTKDGFDSLIGVLPDSWRIEGKIDIDGALAAGKTKADIHGVCQRALKAKDYYDGLEKDAQDVIRKKEAKRYFRTHIRVDFGHYVARRQVGKREWEDDISNFTMKIMATHETHEGIIRELRFINEFGKSAPFFAIKPEDMSGNDGFAAFCMGHGNYVWKGRKEDLLAIWEHEFLNDSGRHISEPDCIGWLPEDKIWMFGNVAFTPEGEMRPDDHGIFWTKKKGFKPVALGVSSGKNIISEGVPVLSTKPLDLVFLKNKLCESIGDFEGKTCLGWAFAVLMMEEVFAMYGCFPFLFVTGRRRSGKSTVAEWMMNLFGLENSGKQAADTTSVAMQRYLSYYSSLPFFVDEYRNDLKVTAKNGLFRNSYNRQSAGKGMKSEFGIREAKIRGTLILAGEETPEDNALLTRCIVVQVSEIRRNVNNFDWFIKNKNLLSAFAYQILSNRADYCTRFMARLVEEKNEIAEHTLDDRLAINKAVVAAGYWTLFGQDKDFAQSFTEEIKVVKAEQESENAVSMFFADVQALSFDKSLRLADYWDVSEGKIYLYFHGLYNIWAKDYQSRKREAPFKADAIRSYLRDEPGFVHTSYPHRVKGGMCKCVVFSDTTAPDFIKDLVTDGSGIKTKVT